MKKHDDSIRRERFDRLAKIVRGMAMKMRPADEDMHQCGLLALWEVLCEHGNHGDSYMIASARHAMIDYLRRLKKRILFELVENAISDGKIDHSMDIDISDIMSLLKTKTRRAFQLHCLSGYTLENTASILGVSIGNVKRLVKRAKLILKRELS